MDFIEPNQARKQDDSKNFVYSISIKIITRESESRLILDREMTVPFSYFSLFNRKLTITSTKNIKKQSQKREKIKKIIHL